MGQIVSFQFLFLGICHSLSFWVALPAFCLQGICKSMNYFWVTAVVNQRLREVAGDHSWCLCLPVITVLN